MLAVTFTDTGDTNCIAKKANPPKVGDAKQTGLRGSNSMAAGLSEIYWGNTMKKKIVAISTAVLLGSVGTAIAGEHKQDICHNASTLVDLETMEYEPISFVISIAGRQYAKAVEKHVENHGDLEDSFLVGDTGEFNCEPGLAEDGATAIKVCEEVTLCSLDETIEL